MINSNAIPVISVDLSSLAIKDANKKAALLTGWSIKKIIGKTVTDLFDISFQHSGEFDNVKLTNKSNQSIDVQLCIEENSDELLVSFWQMAPQSNEPNTFSTSDSQKKEALQNIIFEISKLSFHDISLKEYLSQIHKLVNQLINAKNIFVALYNKDTNQYMFPYYADEYYDFETEEWVYQPNTCTDFIRKSRTAQIITEDTLPTLFEEEGFNLIGKLAPVWMGAPLIDSSTDEVIGVIGIQDYHHKDAYSQEDLKTIEIIANNIGLFIDRVKNLEEIKKVTEAFLEGEQRYRSLFNDNGSVMLLIDPDTNYISDANPAACRYYGYSHDQITKLKVQDLNPLSEKKIKTLIEKSFKKEKNYFVFKHRLADGSIRDVEVFSGPLKYGNKLVMYSIVHDITDRKIAEEALVKLSRAVEQSSASIIITNKNGKIEYVNPKTLQVSGYSLEELIGKNPNVLSSGEKPKKEYKLLWDTISSGKEWRGEFHNRRKNGELYWEQATLSPILNDSGEITHFLAVKEDVTNEKRNRQIQNVIYNISEAAISNKNLEELVEMIRQELSTIIDTSNFNLALYNSQNDTISLPFFANQEKSTEVLQTENTPTKYVIRTKKSLLARQETINEMVKSGEIRHFDKKCKIWLGVPLKIEGEVTGVIDVQSYENENAFNNSDQKILEFISDQISMAIQRKKQEEDLKSALIKAEESDRLKSAFLANMSHEIRTPMNGILGFTSLLKESRISIEKRQSFLDLIEKSGKRMLNTVNDIVNLSKIDSGLVDVSVTEINVNEQMEFIYFLYRTEAEEKGVTMHFKPTLSSQEFILKTDKEKFSAILTNLIKNAIKFTEKGFIEIGYKLKEASIEFYVKDTGRGIDTEKTEVIFQRFRQDSELITRDYEGSGLGLTIAKAYVELLGGEIWVVSKKGQGSTFYFTLPAHFPKLSELQNEQKTSFEGLDQPFKKLKILIAEDDMISELYVTEIVRPLASEVYFADTGILAVENCRNHPDLDLIIMDAIMPEMDGVEATRKIREFNTETVIIAQTAYASELDEEEFIQAGCNEYISKPIKRAELGKLIKKYFK